MPTPETAPVPSARFDFNKAARDIVSDHPELKRNTVFVDLDTNTRIGPRMARIRATLSGKFRKMIKDKRQKAEQLQRGSAHALADGSGVNMLAMTLDRPFGLLHGAGLTDEMDRLFAFNHEIGHLIIPAGHAGKLDNFFSKLFGISNSGREVAADVYATIRHLQKYGADSAPLEFAPFKRATDTMNNSHDDAQSYVTSFAIDAVLRDRHKLAAANLTPAQVVEKVNEYHLRYTPTRAQVDALLKDFAPLKNEIPKISRQNTAPLLTLAEIALDPATSPQAFYMANRVLGVFLGKMLTGPVWVDIARQLHEKEKTITLDTLFPPPEKRAIPATLPRRAA
ncbi:MAG: hypothetical protein IT560_15035 [Alphaproteobacteria bacterium]|nr:hypothetical protein [Alphaproteobacteria bacterium]